MLFSKPLTLRLFIVLTSLVLIVGACTSQTAGKSKEGNKSSGKAGQLENSDKAYKVPLYTIGIVKFDSRPKVNISGLSEAATTILQSNLEMAGLKTYLLDRNVLTESNISKGLLESKSDKNGDAESDIGIDALDFGLSGSITSYEEIEGSETKDPDKRYELARIKLEYALYDFATGKNLLAESATGEYRKTSTGEMGHVAGPSSKNDLQNSSLRNALAKVAEKVKLKLNDLPFQGKLLAVDGPLLIVKAGHRSRLKEGTQLAVDHISVALVEPDSGRVLAYKASKIGIIKLTSHQNEYLSSAKVVSGSGFQIGDLAKPIP